MTTEIIKHTPGGYEELSNMAKAFVSSGMFTDTKQISQAIVKIQAGKELGLPPVYSMQNINLIRGRLTSSANVMAMLIKSSEKYTYKIKGHDDNQCSIDFFELDKDKWAFIGNSTFTMEDAKRADLVKPDSGWMKFPRAMLFSRAISQGARIYAPDAIGGMYTDEEIRSIPPRPEDELIVDSSLQIVDITPAQEQQPKGGASPPLTPGRGQAVRPPASKPAPATGEPQSQTPPEINENAPVVAEAAVDTTPPTPDPSLKAAKQAKWGEINQLVKNRACVENVVISAKLVALKLGCSVEELKDPAVRDWITLDELQAVVDEWSDK